MRLLGPERNSMLVQLVPLRDDGTRDESLAAMTVDAAQVQATFPAAGAQEVEARKLEVFREALRLFEADPGLLRRAQTLVPDVPDPEPRYKPNPGRDRVYEGLKAVHDAVFPSPGESRVRRVLIAPEQATISFETWVDWDIWHLDSEDWDLAVYRNGQPFGDPLIEIWRGEDEAPWPESEGGA